MRIIAMILVAISDKWKKLAKAVGSAIARAAIEPDPLITQLVNPKELSYRRVVSSVHIDDHSARSGVAGSKLCKAQPS